MSNYGAQQHDTNAHCHASCPRGTHKQSPTAAWKRSVKPSHALLFSWNICSKSPGNGAQYTFDDIANRWLALYIYFRTSIYCNFTTNATTHFYFMLPFQRGHVCIKGGATRLLPCVAKLNASNVVRTLPKFSPVYSHSGSNPWMEKKQKIASDLKKKKRNVHTIRARMHQMWKESGSKFRTDSTDQSRTNNRATHTHTQMLKHTWIWISFWRNWDKKWHASVTYILWLSAL